MSFATVTAPTDFRYTFTGEDFDTACRAIWGEVGSEGSTWEADAHLFAMLGYVERGRYPTLDEAFKHYSSPVNPRATLTERRRQIRTMPLTDIPAPVRSRIGAWMGGDPIWTVNGVDLAALKHFGACREESSVAHGTPDLAGAGGQCYWLAEDWRPHYAFDGRGAPPGGGGLSLLAGLVALGGIVYGGTRW